MNSKNSPWLLIATLTIIMTLYAFAQDDESEINGSSSSQPNAIITCNGVNYKTNEDIIRSLVSDIKDFTAMLPQLQGTANDLTIDNLKQTLINPLNELSLSLSNINSNIDVIDSDSISSNLVQFQSLQAILSDYVSAVTSIEDQQITLPETLLNTKTRFQECVCKLTYLIRIANEGF